MRGRIYLDYAATSPLIEPAQKVLEAFMACDSQFSALQANANSLHSDGRAAFAALEDARKRMARVLGVRPHELIFTSGATESNMLALFGLVCARKTSRQPVHIVTTDIEHDAVYKTAKVLEQLGLARVSFVAPISSGHIDPAAIEQALEEDTVLVSIIMAHNETGAINDIATIGQLLHERGIVFHSDAVQALGKVSLDLGQLPLDAASFSAHKIGGPKGVGLLYLANSTAFKSLSPGGGQEQGRRGGTQNVAGIAAFAAALEACCGNEKDIASRSQSMTALRDKLYTKLCSYPQVHASVPCLLQPYSYLPHIVNVCVDGIESETLILQLDLEGFSVSGGSACSSHSLDPSRSLLAIGIPRDRALCSLRISLGPTTRVDEIDAFLESFDSVITRLS